MIGKRIGKYIIQEKLGQGGMGIVYKAIHPALERDVAIKLIHIARADNRAMLERFRREAKVVATLRHPGIVQLYDFDVKDDMLYMVMEYIPGESLARRLTNLKHQGRQMPLDETLRIFRLITKAVAYAHQRNIIHCDLKPDNVLLSPEGQPILTDFGLSKFINAERLTVSGDMFGTPLYMAPEQAVGARLGTYTDVYALGIMLYELSAGALPFTGGAAMTIAFKHVSQIPDPPSALRADISPALEEIIQKAMAKTAPERYPSARELLAAIEALPQIKPLLNAASDTRIISEDGQPVFKNAASVPPLPAFDATFMQELIVPGGAVKLRDKFYIQRAADAQLKPQSVQWGTTTTIRAPRQTGKTSLLMRGIQYARNQNVKVVFLDFQSFGIRQLSSLDLFLQEVAASICDELDLDDSTVEPAFSGSRSPIKKLTRFIEKTVLPAFQSPIVLAMDEADFLLQTNFYQDFFAMLRSWHNRRASRPAWEKLNLILVISTEPYLLIDDIHQSPFNVGLHLYLDDFNEAQVRELNRRHASPLDEDDLPRLMTLLNGHPFLTRLALYKLIAEKMSWDELNTLAPGDAGPFGDHLRHQYRIVHNKPALKNALKDILLNNTCSDETALFRLLQAGLIKGSGNVYTYRCDLYRQYFAGKLL